MCPAPLRINPALANILYVDDEANNLVSFTAAFRKYFNVFTANSAKEGMDILRLHPMSLIVTDQRMPEMTGVQFLEAVIPEYPDTVRMVLTGFSDVEAIIRAINTGRVFRYITKPWDQDELKLILDTAIKIYNLEKENRELVIKLQKELEIQKRIISLFQKYVPPDVVNEAIKEENEFSIIQGETRIVSILFSDIRHFTELTAKLEPKVLVDFLNRYFTVMTECVKAHKGTINKFLGDGILALFGAPLSYIDNQYNAIACALEMLKRLEAFNKEFSALVGCEIKIGIGINTGEVTAGTIGSSEKVEYTVIGDTVNVAARIVELTKDAPNTILISESTYFPAKERIRVEEIPPQILHGKENKINLFKVIEEINI